MRGLFLSVLKSSMTKYIGLVGRARSGKDTVAHHLIEKHGYTRVAFADRMRDAVEALNPIIRLNVEGLQHTCSLITGLKMYGWEGLKTYSPDIRGYLQRMGTEVGRDMFGDDFWVNQGLTVASQYEQVVFSDVRYPNEADILRAKGGTLWRIEREGIEKSDEHTSEALIETIKVDAVIKNSGTLDELFAKVDKLMGKTSGNK